MERMTRKYFLLVVLAFVLALTTSFQDLGQETGSPRDLSAPVTPGAAPPSSPTGAPAPDAPSAALRDLLAAACAHDEPSFEKFLTARNAQSFSQLTPAARTELMKRFVLLDGAGTPTISSDPSGRPDIRCTTA